MAHLLRSKADLGFPEDFKIDMTVVSATRSSEGSHRPHAVAAYSKLICTSPERSLFDEQPSLKPEHLS